MPCCFRYSFSSLLRLAAELRELFCSPIPGVFARFNGSPFYVTKVPDLIGFRDRSYIDHTATHRHREIGDLMRYAALVSLSDSGDFGPHRLLTDAQRALRSLEDLFSPERLREDYVPSGFKRYPVGKGPIRGHEFGLKLSLDKRSALISFLRTL